MREFLTSGVVGNIELNEQKRIRQAVTERWDSLGMTEGLKGVIKENISLLFENEAKALLKEATASDNSGSFETVVFPIIRRVFSKLLANDIVSVQAMNLPVGRLFFMLPVTSEREFNGTMQDAMNGEMVGFFETKETLLRDYISKENYAAIAALFYFSYVIDYKGEWHQMWPYDAWGCNICDRIRWAQEFIQNFVRPLNPKRYRMTIVDIHR